MTKEWMVVNLTAQTIVFNSLIRWKSWVTPAVITPILLITSQFNHLAFHTLIELSTILISFLMFSLAWSTKRFTRNDFLIFLACGYLWIGLLDLMHSLVYKGMNVFVEGSGNLSVQFWLSARYLEAILLFAAPFAATRKQNGYFLVSMFGVLAVGLSTLILFGYFPVGFIEGYGTTSFKSYSEYLIIFILILALFNIKRNRTGISISEKRFTSAAIILTICAETSFTNYVEIYGFANIIGHVFKLCSFWLLFNTIVISNLKKPFIALRNSEECFKRLFENSEVSIWNEDFSEAIFTLQKLRRKGVTDLSQYLKKNEQMAWELAAMVRVNSVNEATLKLFGAKSTEEFHCRINETFADNAIDTFKKALNAIWEKRKTFRSEANYRTLDGEIITCIISFQIPETVDGFHSIPVTIVDITRQKRNEARIWHQANFDNLTGLANRNLFSDRLSNALKHTKENQTSVALLCIDLDGFKYVNDTMGHQVGDKLLQETSQRLVSLVRKSDTIARLGGDEFAILLHDISSHEIEASVHEILRTLAQPYHLEGRDSFVSASIGVAVAPNDGHDSVTLMRKADSALYKAKAKGRNNFEIFTPKIDIEATHRRELEEALHLAVKNKEFNIHYQPIVNAVTGSVDCVEALIRWNHPDKGAISPFKFIPLAEEIGLIAPIGEWVLRESCKAAMAWSTIVKEPPGISVNVSSRQFQDQNILDLVQLVLLETKLPAEKLTLEITESLLLADIQAILEQLKAIRSLGVKLSIDDFGTGYSSLSYLKKLPVSTLKIDRSFVMNLPTDSEDVTLVKTILLMTKSLSLDVVAEGVETEVQAEFLQSSGCQYLQGYLYSKPLSNSDLMDYLSKHSQSACSEKVPEYLSG
ncbi:hypothetical protein DI392_10010 [Vibrio albus]|uniref:cyclic-guanylate-specific phosphodiesterase n=1 Tax=Vibrio albus TaxID=2200953 RepID=A0A2U3B8U3_9VIBR|nr:EAL domain-containing protein [Vibrio albus]PWI33191.1 hypothetical protein DI392_10010 [Vibrio albus]